MAYSRQDAVSDGTLQVLDVSIQYMRRADVFVLLDDVLTTDWGWVGALNSIAFPAPLANGVKVTVVRRTRQDKVTHEFAKGALFNSTTMDTDFRQMLYLAQEYIEGSAQPDYYQNLNMHGFRVTNVGDAVADTDAVNRRSMLTEYSGIQSVADNALAVASGVDAKAQLALTTTNNITGPNGSTYIKHASRGSAPSSTLAYILNNWMPVNVREWGAKGDGATDDTLAIQAAVDYAHANYLDVYIPAGEYVVSRINFGSQNQTGQSSAPLSFIGSSRGGTRFKIKPGTSGGFLFKGESLAGVTIAKFSINTVGTNVGCINMDWKAGSGPSTHNVVEDITLDFGTAPVAFSMTDLNDTIPFRVYVNGASQSSYGFSMVQSGGLVGLRECTWNNCKLKIGGQNGAIYDSWGFGIEAAAACVNNITIVGGYLYHNVLRGANVWSESYGNFQSMHSLTISGGTQIIGPDRSVPGACFFDLNLYSCLKGSGIEFLDIESFPVNLFGPNSRRDSFQNATVHLEGGSFSGAVTVNEVSAYDISKSGFMSKVTGLSPGNFSKNVYLTLSGSGSFGSGVWYDLVSAGALSPGVYQLTFDWGGPNAPYLLSAHGTVVIPPAVGNLLSDGPAIPTVVGEYFPASNTVFSLRLGTTLVDSLPKVQFRSSVALDPSGAYLVSLTKIY